MVEQTKTLAGILQVLEVKEDRLKLQIGNVKPTAWAKSCTTAFDEIKALAGKNVIADYEEGANKQFPNNPYKNIIKVVENTATPAVAESESHPTDNGMTKEDWGLKDKRITRVAIAKSIIEARGEWEIDACFQWADRWFNWVYEQPPTAPTKLQEGKKSSIIGQVPPAQGPRTPLQLIDEINSLMGTLKLGTKAVNQKAIDIATENKWPNLAEITAGGYKVLNTGQLAHLIAVIRTEGAKGAK